MNVYGLKIGFTSECISQMRKERGNDPSLNLIDVQVTFDGHNYVFSFEEFLTRLNLLQGVSFVGDMKRDSEQKRKSGGDVTMTMSFEDTVKHYIAVADAQLRCGCTVCEHKLHILAEVLYQLFKKDVGFNVEEITQSDER